MDHWKLYHDAVPAFLAEMAAAPAMGRLKNVGMNCGCEYTAFPRFRGLAPYSRFDHSMGAALIVWHFTRDPAQSAAGLFHDISTPVFAHVVDFLRGDYLRQETTEDGAAETIRRSPELCAALDRYGIPAEDVTDCHRYPIADSSAPRLCADRLEYTLGNLLNFRLADRAAAETYYRDLTVCPNEDGEAELMFRTGETALSFARGALACSEIYVSREDRYAMQILSELLRDALAAGALSPADLDTDEPAVIAKLRSDHVFSRRWDAFCALREMEAAPRPGAGDGWRQVFAKRRHMDPAVAGEGRVSALFPEYGDALRAFLAGDQTEWLRGR